MVLLNNNKWEIKMKYKDTLKKVRDNKEHVDPIKGYDGKWMSLYFTTDGRTHNDGEVHDTEDLAKECADNVFEVLSHNTHIIFIDSGLKYPKNQLSGAIQMPTT